jgi:hypothetical protein
VRGNPRGPVLEIDAVGTKEDGGEEGCSHTIVTSITREEVEEMIHFLASMRWLARGSKPDPEGLERHRAVIAAKCAPAAPEGEAAHA